MADAVDTHASPREYKHHQRYSRFARVRHSKQALEFYAAEATRLSTTSAAIFTALDSYTADQIRAATSKTQLGIS